MDYVYNRKVSMRETLELIEKEFDSFFEFEKEDKNYVTSTSCKLFAEHCVEIVSKKYDKQIAECHRSADRVFDSCTGFLKQEEIDVIEQSNRSDLKILRII